MFKFQKNDIFYNTLKVYPQNKFTIYDGHLWYNFRPEESGALNAQVPLSCSGGFVSLHEYNVDRPNDSLIFPFVYKSGNALAFNAMSTASYASALYGDILTGSYPLTGSIYRTPYIAAAARPHVDALQNTINYYAILGQHYTYSDFETKALSMIAIPEIFYGSSIRKGSIDLKFYISGTLMARLQDTKRNGQLVETVGTSTGSIAGIALYNEGILLLTGSWALEDTARDYLNNGANLMTSSWLYYGAGMNDGIPSGINPSASFDLDFSGQDYIQTITMFAHAPAGELNHSNNPTFPRRNQDAILNVITGTQHYKEHSKLDIANIVKTPYDSPTGSFEKITMISSVKIYDSERNVIAIAKLANPLRKKIKDDYSIKIKLDI